MLLFSSWYEWTQGSFFAPGTYAFSQAWYPEPPIIYVVMFNLLAAPAIVIYARGLIAAKRKKLRVDQVVNAFGLIVACVPPVAAFLLPLISELLHLSRYDG